MFALTLAAALLAPAQTTPLRDDFSGVTGCFAAHILLFEKDGGPRDAAMAKAKPFHERALALLPAGANLGEKVDTAKRTLISVNTMLSADPYPKIREYAADCDARIAAVN